MNLVWLFIFVLGLAIGALVAWLFAERKSRAVASSLRTAAALAEQRSADLQNQLSAEKSQVELIRRSLSDSEKQAAALVVQLAAAGENVQQQRLLLDDAQARLKTAFAAVSSEALAKNNEAFLALARERFATLSAEAAGSLDQRKTQIEALLNPMRELMAQYQLRVGEIEKSRVESYSMLREQLGVLAETQRTLNTQTGQLVTALSRPTVRGQWGEISLRRLVELAGLSSKCDFVEQVTVTTEDVKLRPDMIVRLPGEREVVIDCKAPLDAFLDAAAAADQDQRRAHLQRHSQQVRNRARELGAKAYWAQFSRSPEYVVMFLPGEAFLYAAVENDPDLIEESLKNRVIIATPTTLIALLKAIEFGWRQAAVAENAEQIQKLGKELYDRIGTVIEHFNKVGGGLAGAVAAYNAAVGSMQGRVVATARKFAELGAKSDKEIPDAVSMDTSVREISALPKD